jgi:ferric-dicitrate binding protein FerR (iron transport regulator)
MRSDEKLRELMLRYLDGALPASDLGALNRAVESDPAARRQLAELMFQETLLTRMGQETELFEIEKTEQRPSTLSTTTQILKIRRKQESQRTFWVALASAAVVLFTLTLLLAVKTFQSPGREPQPVAGSVGEAQPPLPAAPVLPAPPRVVAAEPGPTTPPPAARPAPAPLVRVAPPRKPKADDRKDPASPFVPEPGPRSPVVSSVPAGPPFLAEPGPRLAETSYARIERLQGDVVVLSGASRKPAKTGMDLLRGQGVETSALGGGAVLRYPDGTRIELGPRTVIWDGSDRPNAKNPEVLRRLRVMTGTATAEVSKQPEGRPFVLSSYHAEAKISAGIVSVLSEPESMRFDLMEGKLRVTRREDQIFVDLEPGHFVVVGRGIGLEIQPIPSFEKPGKNGRPK